MQYNQSNNKVGNVLPSNVLSQRHISNRPYETQKHVPLKALRPLSSGGYGGSRDFNDKDDINVQVTVVNNLGGANALMKSRP